MKVILEPSDFKDNTIAGWDAPEIESIIADSFLPDANNTYDLGSYPFSWRNVYVSGTLYAGTISGTITGYIPSSTTTLDGMIIGGSTPAAGTFNALSVKAGNELKIFNTGNTYYLGIRATSSMIMNTDYYFPPGYGADNQFLKTDGQGNLRWADAELPGILAFYATNWTSDIAGKYVAWQGVATTTQVDTTSAALSDGNTLLVTRVTPSSSPSLTEIPEGSWDEHWHGYKSNSSKVVRIYAEFYKRSAAGAETLIGTTESSNVLTTVNEQYNMHLATSTISLVATDRLEIKIYANVSGSGVAPTVTQSIMGNTDTKFIIPSMIEPGIGLPGGSDTYVQFNDSGRFGGNSYLIFNKTTGLATIKAVSSTLLSAAMIDVGGTATSSIRGGTTRNTTSTIAGDLNVLGTISRFGRIETTTSTFILNLGYSGATGTRSNVTDMYVPYNCVVQEVVLTASSTPTTGQPTAIDIGFSASNGATTNTIFNSSQILQLNATGMTTSAPSTYIANPLLTKGGFLSASTTQYGGHAGMKAYIMCAR